MVCTVSYESTRKYGDTDSFSGASVEQALGTFYDDDRFLGVVGDAVKGREAPQQSRNLNRDKAPE